MHIKISKNRYIGESHPCFVIAEAGINHNGDISIARKIVDAAYECGVNAIKFQTFKANEFVSDKHQAYTYYSQGKEVTESMLTMFKKYEFKLEDWKQIIKYCKFRGITFLTTPQNPSDLDLILDITGLLLIKVGADDLTNLELLDYYAGKGIPIMISSGMAFVSEIEDAVKTIRKAGNNDIIVLHCVSSYPTDAEEVNLKKMKTIRDAFQVIVGFSDHTIGTTAAIGAVAYGASVIEKHFTLDKSLPGPDHWFSADPVELNELVKSVRYMEKAIGSARILPTDKEMQMRKLVRRSIVASKPIKKGQRITRARIGFRRPGTGLPPKFVTMIVGKKAVNDLKKNELITLDNVS